MRAFIIALAVVVAPAVALANDGRNRYEGAVPARLVHVDGPVSDDAGWRVLAKDMGGADGEPAYRWAQRHGIALVRVAAHRVETALGAGPFPVAFFDLSAENADTPIGLRDGRPRGRHPGGSHDGGQNLDLGYYLTSEIGRDGAPDHAACSEHHADGEDVYRCTGPADRLDTDRETLLLLELVRVHRERFAGELIETIGIDAVIRKAVLARAREWQGRRSGVTVPLVDELERLFASSPYEGWASSHHHHVHLRLRGLDEGGPHAVAMASLVAEDRGLEGKLLVAAGGESADRGVALGAELASQSLGRELELRLLGEPKALAAVRNVRFRAGAGDWEAPADPLQPFHHVFDAARSSEPDSVVAEAEVTWDDGSRSVLRRVVMLPRQPGWLRVKVEAAGFRGLVRRDGDEMELGLDFPSVYSALVTGIELVITRTRGEPERLPLAAPVWSVRVSGTDPAPLELVEADVTLSGRMHLIVPVVVPAPAAPGAK